MDNESENFDQLRRLLALKKHEQPPPGYFKRFSTDVLSQLQEQRNAEPDLLARLDEQAPWLLRLWRVLDAKPLFAGAFGAAVCGLVLAGIMVSEKPAGQPAFAAPSPAETHEPFASASVGGGLGTSGDLGQPILLTSTNPVGTSIPNLFDVMQPYSAMPASAPAN